jgi:hypothetical protein
MSTDRGASRRGQDDDPRMTRQFDTNDFRTQSRDGDLEPTEIGAYERQDDNRARIYEQPARTARGRRREERTEARRRAPDERIRELILALGDPNHPEHAQAVSELVAIGPAAVPALGSALSPDRPWLTAYRAAETIAQIGDGRASGSLIAALRHPNSNVRWSVVRALAEVGDTRTLWALRRVAHDDRGKTSWGESVADTAQFALDRLQSRSALLRFSDPVKTALVFVAMFAALLFAGDRVQALLTELRRSVEAPDIAAVAAEDATAGPDDTSAGAASETATAEPAATPTTRALTTPTPSVIVSTVKSGSGNVRSSAGLGDNVIGIVNEGDELIFLAVSGDWYYVELGEERSARSNIQGGRGWVSRVVVNEPSRRPPQVTPTRTP